jgi:hypothetical protein
MANARSQLSQFIREVLRSAVVGAVGKALTAAVLAVGGLVALLVVQGGSLPAWLSLLLVAIAAAVATVLYLRVRKSRLIIEERDERVRELEGLEERCAELQQVVDVFDSALERYELYGAHIAHILGHLQRVSRATSRMSRSPTSSSAGYSHRRATRSRTRPPRTYAYQSCCPIARATSECDGSASISSWGGKAATPRPLLGRSVEPTVRTHSQPGRYRSSTSS